MTMKHPFGLAVIFFLMTGCVALAESSVTIGESVAIFSKKLGEERPLRIHLPADYERGPEKRYPVLFLLDGETHFKMAVGTVGWLQYAVDTMPDHIIVAIANTPGNRERDLLAADSGQGAVKFRDFLEQELIPHINKQYRTQPFRILSGHSMAGVFVLQTLLEKPDLFQAYLAMSPFIVANQGKLLKQALHMASNNELPARFLYLTLGDEPGLRTAFDQLVVGIEKTNSPEFDGHSQILAGETHMTVPPLSLHHGMKAVYADLQLKPDAPAAQAGLEGIQAYYQRLSQKKYGFEVSAEGALRQLGIAAARKGDLKEAVRILRASTAAYPKSWRAQMALSQILQAGGQLKAALAAGKTAQKLAEAEKADTAVAIKGYVAQLQAKINANADQN